MRQLDLFSFETVRSVFIQKCRTMLAQLDRYRVTIAFALIIAFLLFTRFTFMESIPATLSHDEMVYAIQAESFVQQGTTLDQTQSFFTLKPSHVMYAEWPAQVMSIGFLLSDQPVIATHLVSALFGVTLPFAVASIVYSIWKDRQIAFFAGLAVVFSPLFWQMSRVGYDAFYSLWFYVLGGALFLKQKPQWIALSVPFFILGFFQYQGFKLLLFPWMLFLFSVMIAHAWGQHAYTWANWTAKIRDFNFFKRISFRQKNLKLILTHKATITQMGVMIGALALMLIYGLVLLPSQGASGRLSKLIFTDTDYIEHIVNTERRLSLANPFESIFSNKITVVILFMLQRLLGVFDPMLLLVIVEPAVSGFSVWTHGLFYWIDIPLIFIGLAAMISSKKTRLSGILFLGGVLTLCLPALINSGGEWYLLRSLFSYLLLVILVGWGAAQIWRQGRSWQIGLLVLYGLSILNFSYHFFYRYPVISLDWSNFDERIVARYIDLTQKHIFIDRDDQAGSTSEYSTVRQSNGETIVTVFADEAEYWFWSYVLYGRKLTATTADEIAASMQQFVPFSNESRYALGSVTFSSFCAPENPRELLKQLDLYEETQSKQHIFIVQANHKTCPNDFFLDELIADRQQLRTLASNESQSTAGSAAPPASAKTDAQTNAKTDRPVLSIASALDSGARLNIYGDELCQSYASTFMHVQSREQLAIETQDIPVFCDNWIKNLDW